MPILRRYRKEPNTSVLSFTFRLCDVPRDAVGRLASLLRQKGQSGARNWPEQWLNRVSIIPLIPWQPLSLFLVFHCPEQNGFLSPVISQSLPVQAIVNTPMVLTKHNNPELVRTRHVREWDTYQAREGVGELVRTGHVREWEPGSIRPLY